MKPQQTIMPVIASSVVGGISREFGINEDEAIAQFYSSKVYALLEDEGSDFWRLSDTALIDMFQKEKKGLPLIGVTNE
jgi:hypothetical protein